MILTLLQRVISFLIVFFAKTILAVFTNLLTLSGVESGLQNVDAVVKTGIKVIT